MKRIFTVALMTLSMVGFAQRFQSIDKQTQIVKRECEIIVVTTDSLIASNMRNVPTLLEEVGCFSSVANSNAKMFWFRIEDAAEVQKALNPYLVKVD